ncbi:MAG: PLP-dependent aminotransferase family protein [Roseburia sp.]|nr:PLP-dependent aminotransferase family protein [Roseburia sp.]
MMYKFSDRIKDLSGTATREILKLTKRADVISFAGGMPATECLPCDIIAQVTADILGGSRAASVLQYGQTEGCAELTEQLIVYLSSLGIQTQADGVQVVSGGQQGLDLMCKAFVNTGDTVLVEDPTYLAFLQIAKTYQANIVGVKADTDGLVLSDLEAKLKKYSPKLLYTVPTFSNPTGKTYTAENRKDILRLCEKYGTIIIEDDPYGRLRYDGADVPPLKTFDKSGSVVYVTSFSKTVAPGLRVALCTGAPEVIRKVSIGKQGADVQSPALCQMIVAEYLKREYFDTVLKKSIELYKRRKDAMIYALEKYMPSEAEFTRPNGGLFIWAELPQYIDTSELLHEAISRNVAFISGKEFFADGSGRNTMRLNFSNSDESRIDRGISVLAELIKGKIKENRQ